MANLIVSSSSLKESSLIKSSPADSDQYFRFSGTIETPGISDSINEDNVDLAWGGHVVDMSRILDGSKTWILLIVFR